jgi:hypothetical protein
MIIVNGKVVDITITPADPDAGQPVETATVKVELSPPDGAGLCNLVVPNAAMGGIAAGACRVMIESA